MTWYEEAIEEPIRNIVKLLRDNGFNTECSCGHAMYVQCQYIPEGEIGRLYTLIYNYLYDTKKPIEFTITVTISVVDGHPYPSLEVAFKEKT